MIATTIITTNNSNIQHLDKDAVARRVTAVAIGRNEGERLMRCLRSLLGQAGRVIYVDSGSTDGSPRRAAELGAEVVNLDMSIPFTAARARNAGLALAGDAELIQFVDGDCEIEPGWLATGVAALDCEPPLGAVAGRRKELHPEATIYNCLCDVEWNTPIGLTMAVGGDVLVRQVAIRAIGGFNPQLIAGEDPEMCLRLNRAGWKVRRLDAAMTRHDANMTRFEQWWKRSRRAGHAFAEVSWQHRSQPEGFWKPETKRALIWSGAGLAILLSALLISPWALLALAIYPLQIARMALRDPLKPHRWARAGFTMLGKLPEALGVAEYHLRRVFGKRASLIEYK